MGSNKQKAKFSFSPRILDHLGISAYNSVQKCLAELVANSYDADAKKVSIEIPDVIDENALIVIEDDGSGMDATQLKEKFLHIGRDRREGGDRSAGGRLIIGSKGIGKLAGFGIASRIKLSTRKDGKQFTITIDKSDLEDISELSTHEFDITTVDTKKENGTVIELLQLHSGLQLPAEDVVRRHIHRVMPAAKDFTITVNGVECTAEDVHGERSDFSQDIEGVGQVTGFYVIANKRQNNPGLAVRVRGRIVQEPSLFGLDTRTHGFFTAEKVVGEINAEFLDPEGQSGERHDLIKTSRDGFLEDSELVKRFNDWAKEFIKKVIQGVDEKETKKRTDILMEQPEIKDRLDALPAHIRSTASSVVKELIRKLKTASDDDATKLVEWVLRYYESNVLKELMHAIASADMHEAERLADLVSQWGLTQLNSVAGIVDTQIKIIERLEELVASDKAYEIDLHKLVESNLWLIQEGLELWSSDKPLKKLLDGKIDEIYEERKDIRPDLICRSRDSGSNAVIIEFKRPKEKIKMEHITQALEYEGLITRHRPNISFETYVIGREYDPSVLSVREKQSKAGLYLWSFEEVLQRSRARFEEILKILGR